MNDWASPWDSNSPPESDIEPQPTLSANSGSLNVSGSFANDVSWGADGVELEPGQHNAWGRGKPSDDSVIQTPTQTERGDFSRDEGYGALGDDEGFWAQTGHVRPERHNGLGETGGQSRVAAPLRGDLDEVLFDFNNVEEVPTQVYQVRSKPNDIFGDFDFGGASTQDEAREDFPGYGKDAPAANNLGSTEAHDSDGEESGTFEDVGHGKLSNLEDLRENSPGREEDQSEEELSGELVVRAETRTLDMPSENATANMEEMPGGTTSDNESGTSVGGEAFETQDVNVHSVVPAAEVRESTGSVINGTPFADLTAPSAWQASEWEEYDEQADADGDVAEPAFEISALGESGTDKAVYAPPVGLSLFPDVGSAQEGIIEADLMVDHRPDSVVDSILRQNNLLYVPYPSAGQGTESGIPVAQADGVMDDFSDFEDANESESICSIVDEEAVVHGAGATPNEQPPNSEAIKYSSSTSDVVEKNNLEESRAAAMQEFELSGAPWDGRVISFDLGYKFIPDLCAPSNLDEAPEDISDQLIGSTSARKTWYRISRMGTYRQHNNADFENYIRATWPGSAIEAEVIDIVAKWVQKDRATSGSVFNLSRRRLQTRLWPDKVTAEARAVAALPVSASQSKSASVVAPPQLGFGWGSSAVSKYPQIARPETPAEAAERARTPTGTPNATRAPQASPQTFDLPISDTVETSAECIAQTHAQPTLNDQDGYDDFGAFTSASPLPTFPFGEYGHEGLQDWSKDSMIHQQAPPPIANIQLIPEAQITSDMDIWFSAPVPVTVSTFHTRQATPIQSSTLRDKDSAKMTAKAILAEAQVDVNGERSTPEPKSQSQDLPGTDRGQGILAALNFFNAHDLFHDAPSSPTADSSGYTATFAAQDTQNTDFGDWLSTSVTPLPQPQPRPLVYDELPHRTGVNGVPQGSDPRTKQPPDLDDWFSASTSSEKNENPASIRNHVVKTSSVFTSEGWSSTPTQSKLAPPPPSSRPMVRLQASRTDADWMSAPPLEHLHGNASSRSVSGVVDTVSVALAAENTADSGDDVEFGAFADFESSGVQVTDDFLDAPTKIPVPANFSDPMNLFDQAKPEFRNSGQPDPSQALSVAPKSERAVQVPQDVRKDLKDFSGFTFFTPTAPKSNPQAVPCSDSLLPLPLQESHAHNYFLNSQDTNAHTTSQSLASFQPMTSSTDNRGSFFALQEEPTIQQSIGHQMALTDEGRFVRGGGEFEGNGVDAEFVRRVVEGLPDLSYMS